MSRLLHIVPVASIAILVAVPASGQPVSRRFIRPVAPPITRAVVSINGGYQGTTTEFGDSFSFTRNQETGTTRVTYPIEAGPTFDVGGSARVWRHLGFGVAVSRFTRTAPIAASASIPHPFFLQQYRDVAGDAEVTREETGVHLQLQYWLPLRGRLQAIVMGGPSVMRVKQAIVTDVNYSEQYPFDEATFTGVDTSAVEASKLGFNVGVDLRWMFTPNVGAGALVRFTRATVDLDVPQDRTVSVKTGGAQVGLGLRVAF